jgi:hypothetical protein
MIYDDVAANAVQIQIDSDKGCVNEAQTYWYSVDMRDAP